MLYRYTIAALHEPSVLPRIVEMFALRDLVPGEVSCRTVQRDGPELRIRVEVCGLDDVHAEHLALRMRNVMPVISVLLERESA